MPSVPKQQAKYRTSQILLAGFIILGGLLYHSISCGKASRSDLEARLDALENKLDSNLNLEISTKIEKLQREVQELRGLLEEHQHAVQEINKGKKLPSTTSILEERLEQKSINKSSLLDIKPASEEAAYESAYKLIEDKHFTEAITAFKDFLWQYNNSKFTPNAIYWLGELYLTEHKFDVAADYFLQVVNKYQQHDKAPDALLKLGLLEIERENWQAAKDYFIQLKKNYASSPRVYMAEANLQSLQRDGH